VSEAAAFATWCGAAVIVLSDGRRAMALGTALIAIGLAGVTLADGGGWLVVAALVLGGTAAAGLRLRSGRPGWGFMPPGSTPRLILSIAGGLVALWLATIVMSGPDPALRYAALVVLSFMAARLLESSEPSIAITAAVCIALALGAASALAPGAESLIPCMLAALIAAGASLLPAARPDGA
jgi:hypothetical protein